MALEFLQHCTFTGPALPEPFVQFELEKELIKANLLPKTVGKEGQALQESWEIYRRKLRELSAIAGVVRVRNQAIEPLRERLGYETLEAAAEVETREGRESGGYLLWSSDRLTKLRVWCTELNIDLDAPAKRGSAYRYSHLRIAQRVLLASGERLGLLTNGVELRILISDPARPDSQITIAIDPHWKRSRNVPDSYLLLLALAAPMGVKALTGLVDKARLQQARVTKDLRVQARQAVERFVQEVLDRPDNRDLLEQYGDRQQLAKDLWREGLIVIYRLLFILKLEASDDTAQSFSFASTSLWRNTFSPSGALTRYARAVLDRGVETGNLLESGLRNLFRMFTEGVECTELNVKPMGGALFGADATPILSKLQWGERAVAHLLDRLLWTTKQRGSVARQRVYYGPLNVEDLGRVYEALLELESGITTEPMCRLRRQKLEVVVPVAQGLKYRPVTLTPQPPLPKGEEEPDSFSPLPLGVREDEPEEEEEPDEEVVAKAGAKKTMVEWIEEIPPNRFYLRVGLGRKASGSYYTPHSFVRFLVQETLGALVTERSPQDDPNPNAILKLKVLDPAMGSGHFLVEACRFLGEKLYEACRLCDDRAIAAEQRAESKPDERDAALAEARLYRQRVIDLPDPDDRLVKYLPSSAPEGGESGYSQTEALALCRRLVAVHCLYGVDKNPLAVELAKLSLWIESHAEGLPLTFLDHRLVLGDSLTGAFFEHLLREPLSQHDVQKLLYQGINQQFRQTMSEALRHVQALEASVGVSIPDLIVKESAKARLDRALAPFKVVAAAWSGGVMLGKAGCDDLAYARLVQVVGATGDLPEDLANEPSLLRMIARGLGIAEVPCDRAALLAVLASDRCVPAFAYDLTFADVFYPDGNLSNRQGFDVVLGNPPWEGIDTSNKEFFAAFDFSILDSKTDTETKTIINRLLDDPEIELQRDKYEEEIQSFKNVTKQVFSYVNLGSGKTSGATPDLYQYFSERGFQITVGAGLIGMVLPSSFHANEGATGIRKLYLESMTIKCCYSFENRGKLFEIDSRIRFAVIVASCKVTEDQFPCAFYLHDDSWLFTDSRTNEELSYSLEFLKATTGEQLNFLELCRQEDVAPAMACYASSKSRFGSLRRHWGVLPTEELHLSKNRWRLVETQQVLPNEEEDPRNPEISKALLEKDFLPLYEGKTIFQFTDCWESRPTSLVPFANLVGKESRLRAAQYYRLGFRTIASSTNERSAIFVMVPPAVLCSHSLSIESQPERRKNWTSLTLLSLTNSFVFDWLLRLVVGANITFNFLDPIPVPSLDHIKLFLSHSALRLNCNHSGYEPLWREQLGNEWREPNQQANTYPVLTTDDQRWQTRAAIDAVVAQAYGLTRDQYAHVLSTFSHKSYPQAPQLCLAHFDELQAIGLENFTRKHDPYWDIPLNENLPQPVIDLPIPPPQDADLFDLTQVTQDSQPKKRKKKAP